MKKDKINDGTQINIFGDTAEKTTNIREFVEADNVYFDKNEKDNTHFNDAGEEISIENGYSSADINDLEKDDDENSL